MQRSLDLLAPAFRAAVERTLARLAGGRTEWPFETLRTQARQAYLYGFGRSYDDGRGRVTNAATHDLSWHGFGLAVDIVEKDGTPWDAPAGFWLALGEAAEAEGLVWGGRWQKPDKPHLQWAKCPVTPSIAARALLASEGMQAVWAFYHAYAESDLTPSAS